VEGEEECGQHPPLVRLRRSGMIRPGGTRYSGNRALPGLEAGAAESFRTPAMPPPSFLGRCAVSLPLCLELLFARCPAPVPGGGSLPGRLPVAVNARHAHEIASSG
jgi:hypothetical protein